MELIVNHLFAGAWVRDRIPKVYSWLDDFKSIAAIERTHQGAGERMLGAVIYDGFTPYDCNMHLAIEDKRCVTRRTLKAIFAYPFEQLQLRRVTALVPESNTVARDLDERLGFVLEGRKAHGFGDDAELIYGMVRENCPWL